MVSLSISIIIEMLVDVKPKSFLMNCFLHRPQFYNFIISIYLMIYRYLAFSLGRTPYFFEKSLDKSQTT